MINYIPGILHESLQKEHFYEVVNEFVSTICNDVRFQNLDDYDTETYCIKFQETDVIVLRYFKYRPDATVYAYIEGYYRNNEFIQISQESIHSREFILINEFLFRDVTKMYERNNKLEKILN